MDELEEDWKGEDCFGDYKTHWRTDPNRPENEMPVGMVCFSGGKDSAAMLLRMLELDDPINYPVNAICFADTTFEFQDLYDYIARMQAYLDHHYPERGLKIEFLKSDKTWEDWFYGEIRRGNSKGKTRAAPLVTLPCWWSREAKVIPLQRRAHSINADWQYIGIAKDEQGRVRPDATKNGIRYPLNEWGWTEQDCLEYLDHLGISNMLYATFSRLGCFHCIKQTARHWFYVWRDFPDYWEIAKFWDKENIRLADQAMTLFGPLEELQKKFEDGFIPNSRREELECQTCSAVAFHADGTVQLEDFETDEAFEHSDLYKKKYRKQDEEKVKILWEPSSVRGKKGRDWI